MGEIAINNNRALYGLAIAGGIGVALWAGLPFYLLFALGCPVMMFFMMRGMNGGQDSRDGQNGHVGSEAHLSTDAHTRSGNGGTESRGVDGSHERIDRP